MATGLETELINILAMFFIAGLIGAVTSKYVDVPYTIALLITGIVLGLLGFNPVVELSHDIIILIILPPLLFEGAASTDVETFRKDLIPISALAIVGLLISIVFLGVVSNIALGIPILSALLLAVIVLPTDPVSVLALFKELGVPERLSVLVEGESLVNDGVSVVIFSTLLAIIVDGSVSQLVDPSNLLQVAGSIGASVLGGSLVGVLTGYLSYVFMKNLDDDMTEIIITITLAYGSFLLAEHYLGVSGVLATVFAGLFISNRTSNAMSATSKITVFNFWKAGSFIVNTFIFISIGLLIPVEQFIQYIDLLIPLIILVLVARAIVVYPIFNIHNFFSDLPVKLEYQHVIFWGGLHGSIPIALALGVPPSVGDQELIRTLAFGVVLFSLVVQGLTVDNLIERLNIVTMSDEKKLYEHLIGVGKVVDIGLEELENMRKENEIPAYLYDEMKNKLENEKEDIEKSISNILSECPELEKEKSVTARRKIHNKQRSEIKKSLRDGELSENTGEKLLRRININIDYTDDGRLEEYEKDDWKEKAEELGVLESDEED